MKNILVLLHDDAGQEARLQAALDLTRALQGHLTCIDVCGHSRLPETLFGGVTREMLKTSPTPLFIAH